MEKLNFHNPNFKYRGEKIRAGRVVLESGQSVGEHTTGRGEELIFVIRGNGKVIIGSKVERICENQSVFIPSETMHNVTNDSKKQFIYIYVVGGK